MGKSTRLEIYSQQKVCLPIVNKPRSNQSYTYNLTIYLSNIFVIVSEHYIFKLKLFNNLCRRVFDPRGKPPKNLIRD